MTEDILRYDILVQNALRGVIRKVLSEIDKTGLPGNHHFFITFLTGAPGVKVSNRVREQYPEQMTIVLQHQFWELEVNETGFGIGLSFSDVPEKLYVPYAAIRGFYDPSVNFELEFDVEQADEDSEADEQPANEAEDTVTLDTSKQSKPKKKTKEKAAKKDASDEPDQDTADEDDDSASADVVSLDAFLFSLTSCDSDKNSLRKVGGNIQGKWAFGINPSCSGKDVMYAEGNAWVMRPADTSLGDIVIAKNVTYQFIDSEVLLNHELLLIEENRKTTYNKHALFYTDYGNVVEAVDLYIEATNARVPLKTVNVDAAALPTLKLTKCPN
ncbi:hypothetical protein GQR58_029817 [Nymphon striatum]|nr:hypothetical protein GQR58_029817 [Nymphon striatum]